MTPDPSLRRFALRRPLATLAAALPLACLGLAAPASAAVVISQVYGGGGNAGATLKNDFIELFNAGSSAVAIGGWSVQYASATGTTWQSTAIPAGTVLQPGRYLLVQQAPGAGGSVNLVADVLGTIPMSGTNGKVALAGNSTAFSGTVPVGAIDFVGYGSATTAEGSPTAVLSNTTAALRNGGGCTDTDLNSADFTLAAPAPRNSATAALSCGAAPAPPPPAPPPAPAPASVAIYTIQGSGAQSPYATQQVSTSGVVTKVNSNGFFMQDLNGDGDPLTSDGIFVFAAPSGFPAVAVGNLVTVVGTVTEFNTGASASAATPTPTLTELTAVSAVTLVGSGYSIAPTRVTLPEATEGDLERYEGMLVTLTGPLTVAQNFFQGRYGQLTLAVGGRLETPTNRHRPGSAQAIALADENARRRIVLDDGSSQQNPSPTPYFGTGALPRAGDTTAAVTGVVDFGLVTASSPGPGDYKLHPTTAPVFSSANPRSSVPAAVGGNVRVASFNVLNYFTTFTDGTTAAGATGQGCTLGSSTAAGNCRGANSLAEFSRQRAKIVEAMLAIDADALGLMELQNNGNVAALNLVEALNARVGAGTYASAALPSQGTGTDAIRVAVVYKPAKLSPVGAPVSDTDPVNNRPPLAQTFSLANGERFTLLVNHLKSKGSCPAAGDADAAGNLDSGDGQGCWNLTRTQQATRLRSFVAERQTAAGSNDLLLIGDFNAYGQEDPIRDLTSSGHVDQISRFSSFGYSYVFDGAAGRLDHAIASAALSAKVTGASAWHINADEAPVSDYNLEFKAPLVCNGAPCPADPTTLSPYRSSDHDPVVVGLNLVKTITAAAGSSAVVGSAGDDLIVSGAGRRSLTGGAGRDQFLFRADFAGGATITDFQPGADLVSLRATLQALRIPAGDPIGQGYLRCSVSGTDALISIDPDAGGPAAARPMLLIKHQGCAVLSAANFSF